MKEGFFCAVEQRSVADGARRLAGKGAKQIQAEARPTQRVKPLRGTS